MKKIGSEYVGNNRCVFTVWAPKKKSMVLHLVHPKEQKIEMTADKWGYFRVEVEDVGPGARYFFRPDDKEDYPDLASHYQPEGVHGPSEVVDHTTYQWNDKEWHGIPFKDLILYELHVGTFTNEGTFEAIIPFLDDLVDMGINALEIMPIAQFPGNRNWGYDGVYPYAVQSSYGGPEGLKKLVDACHQKGLAVILDVVYNHMGPEGNYFAQFAPYFTKQYCTPWGDAINYDSEWSDGVRDFFSNNPQHWFELYHIDGLRLDAIHTIYDVGAVHFWELMHHKVKALEQKMGRTLHLIAESDLNDPRVIKSPEMGGFGFTAQWLDDFHHASYVLLHPEGKDRYGDFGQMEQLAKAYTDGFVHSGEYVDFRKRQYGASSAGIPGDKFIVFNQNHDQIGNRVGGERLSMLVSFERLKMAAAAIMLSPYIPMLFMGEEYAADTPFFYFVSHSEKELIEAIRKGRKEEFSSFGWDAEPPDAQAEDTFVQSRLQWQKRSQGKYQTMLQWHKTLIQLRRTNPVLQNSSKVDLRVNLLDQSGFNLHRQSTDGQQHLFCLFNVSDEPIFYTFPQWASSWTKLLDSRESQWLETASEETQVLPNQVYRGQKIQLAPCSVAVFTYTNDLTS
ncbi:malto-oligosyltrehalose trehalohydrolase [Tellurirhabdus bombi]|uniref:malto-oligosyltrehalose trehalohydrolase n=1 Tax=Tellurirhabdus bombi TaxID=2907205 RepID=UPI001F170B83|nr:malto-oligosyltrehalose trehalohydrolase [Tellurirhabdus bombi]